jgi:Polysaccharide deacetylase
MKKIVKHGSILSVLFLALLVSAAYRHRSGTHENASVDKLLLLLPDSLNENDPLVGEWLDAAKEEGLHLEIVRDSTLLDPMSQFHAAGLIVPDQVHRNANDALIGALENYVRSGGKLMLVYDACTLDLNGFFPKIESRLSNMIGVRYALYDKYKKNTMEFEQVWGSKQTMEKLKIPPGKFVPLDSGGQAVWLQPVAWNGPASGKADTTRYTFSRYLYNDLVYPSFRTSGTFDGDVLLESKAGLVAGQRKYELGNVLFVNLPLGYLESRTDGLLLHSFLHYFAANILDLPYLASVPDGTGGLVLNWHVDAESSIKPLAILQHAGVFDQGPYSIHLTAGPDVNRFNDGKGLNIEQNRKAQELIKYFLEHGHVVGSHGGWIHNWFGEHLDDNNEAQLKQYLLLNDQALEKVSQEKIREYSAPMGNHPAWVTDWLQQHGFLGYYFPGDSGMGPTLVYRDKGRDAPIWGFPILHLGTEASFEEMEWDHVPQKAVEDWLVAVADYSANDHVARLLYSHPFGATRYVSALQKWLQHTRELSAEKRFRWYTMTSLAEFLNTRKNVQWTLGRSEKKFLLEASHPKSLVHQTWIFPDSQYRNLKVVQGSATIQQKDNLWLVTANDCKHLAVELDANVLEGGSETRKN